LLLHGAGGPGFFLDRPEYRRYPEALVAAGFRVVMPYFAESHDVPARTARRTLDALRAGRVGVVGFSQGGFIGSCVAGTDERVVAFVSFYGGLDEGCAERITRMPPTLALHGQADQLVPPDRSDTLAKFVRAKRSLAAVKLYPGQEHGFRGDALDDSARLAVEFLTEHLAGDGR